MAETNTSDIGFEKQIWDAACVLRGNLDASEYKSVVLGLIFLKYISDRFEAKYNELAAEGDGFEEDKDEYTAENIFFVPESARWSVISAAAHTPEVGAVIDEAMCAIEKENKRLKDILPKNFARPELDKRRLGDVVDLFTNIQMIEHGSSKDILGRTYEYCLSKFAEQEGKLAGEFYTPACVVRTLVEVLQPYDGRVYDPCCGSGGMFVQSAKFIENHGGNINKISVFGQDSNPTTWKLAQMNLAIRGIEADLGKFNADTFFNDCHPQLKADFILANPPFNLSGWGQDKLAGDVRWAYGLPPAGNANFAWLQHMIWHLAPGGRIGMVLANTALSISTGEEYQIRKGIIEDNLVSAIVSLPAQLFYSTKIRASIWFLSRQKKTDGILFVDARGLGHMVSRTLKEFSNEDIEHIAKTVHTFEKTGAVEKVAGFCCIATLEEIRKKNYNISPSKYVVGSIDVGDIGEYSSEIDDDIYRMEYVHQKIGDTRFDAPKAETISENFQSLLSYVTELDDTRTHILFQKMSNRMTAHKEISEIMKDISDKLFKYWFVDFNFFNSNGAPYKDNQGELIESEFGMIPSGWRVIEMGGFLTPFSEKVGDKIGIPEYSTTNLGIFPRASKFNKSLSKDSKKNKLVRKGDIVFGMSREIFNFGVMKDEIGSVSPAYHVYCINSDLMNPEFLEVYMRLCSDYFSSLIKPGAREGQVLDKDELIHKKVLCPPIPLQEKYVLIRNNFANWLL